MLSSTTIWDENSGKQRAFQYLNKLGHFQLVASSLKQEAKRTQYMFY